MAENWTGSTLNVAAGSLQNASMRYHELALQNWLNRVFLLRWGVPVPVVFAVPMDAFSVFSKLWAQSNNPFQYLLDIKDENGVPCYLPHPSPVRYPLISVFRRNWKLRHSHNFSIHRMRWLNYPTVSDDKKLNFSSYPQQGTDLTLCQLGEVTTSRFPMAVDYRFQIDFFCNRPDTQAYFVSQFFKEFWRTGGNQLQTWTPVTYPGLGDKLIRLYVETDLENTTSEEPPQDGNVEFRCSFTLVMEGYDVDVNYKIYPALWKLILQNGPVAPDELKIVFGQLKFDLRENPENSTIEYKYKTAKMPPKGECGTNLRNLRLQQKQIHEIQCNSIWAQNFNESEYPGIPMAARIAAFGTGQITAI